MVKKIVPNRIVNGYCRECDEIQEARLRSFDSKDGARCSKCQGLLDRIRGNRVPRKLRIVTPDTIDYPKQESEFEVQAYIYHSLRAKGYDVRGEVTTRQSSAVLDLVVFDGRTAVLIIEVKAALKRISGRTRKLLAESDQEQADYYKSLGVPVQRVCGMRWAKKFCESFQLPIAQKG